MSAVPYGNGRAGNWLVPLLAGSLIAILGFMGSQLWSINARLSVVEATLAIMEAKVAVR